MEHVQLRPQQPDQHGRGIIPPEGESLEFGEEASKLERIAELTEEAEAKYSNLAAKVGNQLRHIWPKYLGGAEDGAVAELRPAYDQLITNLFRQLAPYGRSAEISAEEVSRIMSQVYSKYPLP